ncbi:glycosyltransferase [Alteromonas aestuariivivens]|uniref:Glycosyltransferase n=1 Tax=Alteromonas aestuariivivens TaxID=1938339 RepID=A0A3D8MD56_9ALTE|nr:glycosyltransferase family 4 protein [Alteromonas aestuariivivens]RDV28170.1 glycosyltransferase [Alteromonas aestuariivivens]
MSDICIIGTRGIPTFVGGIETICRELYPRIKKMSPKWTVTILSRLPVDQSSRYTYEGVDVRVIRSVKASGLETFVHTFIALLYARLVLHPKVVHLHGIGPGFFSWLSRGLLFKTIVTHHSQDYLRPKWSWSARTILKVGELFTCIFANKIICVSAAVKQDLDKRYPFLTDKRIVIRNAGSLEFDNIDPNPRVLSELKLRSKGYILAVGRLEETKAFHELIEAFINARPKDMDLVIVGSNYVQTAYIKELNKYSSDQIIFAGSRFGQELAELYAHAALLANPSHMEGFCLVVAEALSANIPIVASDIPPHREFLLPEQCYSPPGDVLALEKKLSVDDFECYRCEDAALLQQLNTWQLNASKHQQVFSEFIHAG